MAQSQDTATQYIRVDWVEFQLMVMVLAVEAERVHLVMALLVHLTVVQQEVLAVPASRTV